MSGMAPRDSEVRAKPGKPVNKDVNHAGPERVKRGAKGGKLGQGTQEIFFLNKMCSLPKLLGNKS